MNTKDSSMSTCSPRLFGLPRRGPGRMCLDWAFDGWHVAAVTSHKCHVSCRIATCLFLLILLYLTSRADPFRSIWRRSTARNPEDLRMWREYAEAERFWSSLLVSSLKLEYNTTACLKHCRILKMILKNMPNTRELIGEMLVPWPFHAQQIATVYWMRFRFQTPVLT